MTVKIFGYGWLGKAMKELFPDALIQDPFQSLTTDQTADICFICVPTPLKDGKLDCSIVESVIKEAKEDLIVVRSTVNPGFCDEMVKKYNKHIVFNPEYLGETVGHPMNDQKGRQWLILGGKQEDTREVINLYQKAYNANVKIRQTTLLEAEVIKLTANRAAAWKMMQMQELYDVCEAAGIDYYVIRDAVYGDDPRHNLWWTWIFQDNRGFNSSKCLVKDLPAWAYWAEKVGATPLITRLLVAKSNEYAIGNHPVT